jgi:hypothetical protein
LYEIKNWIFGPFLETFVFSEVLKQASWFGESCALYHYRDKDQDEVDLVIEAGSGALVGIEVKASATVNAGDFKGLRSWRRPAAITSSWEWFSMLAEGRSPSATVLLLRQCLACGRDSIFAVFGRNGCRFAIRHYIPGSDGGLDFQAMCSLTGGTHVRKITMD